MQTFTVIGIYEETRQRYAAPHDADSHEQAEMAALCENPELIVVASIKGDVTKELDSEVVVREG